MTFKEIINKTTTGLPLVRSNGVDFREFIFNKLDTFNQLIQNSDDLVGSENIEPFDENNFKSLNKRLIKGIKNAINGYYEGNPNKAYRVLSMTLKECEINTYLDKSSKIGRRSSFYRIRIKDSNYPVGREEIFHIPFNMREKVATQRYSIPGLPSLYLANSLFVAWEELGRPSDNLIQAARFKNTRDLHLLDLTSDIYYQPFNKLIKKPITQYNMMVWPLIAACSVKVPDRDVDFKPEYIIPQLLLQWINKNEIDGIKYSSTHIEQSKNCHTGQMYNVVVPVKTFIKSQGHCPELIELFKVSNVMPMQLNQFSLNSNSEDETFGKLGLTTIELIKGKEINYSESIFGKIELQLQNLPIEKLPVVNKKLNFMGVDAQFESLAKLINTSKPIK